MKSIKPLLTIVSCLFLNQVALANDEVYFDLHEQLFSETLLENRVSARYDLPKSYVTTNLNYSSTYYTTSDTGLFKVELKKPLTSWGVSLDVEYKFSDYNKEKRSIVLTAENGSSFIFGCSKVGIYFNGDKIYTPQDSERLSIMIRKDSLDTVTVNIHGSEVASVTRSDFSKLKYVELQLVRERDGSSSVSYSNDVMNNLIIAGE
jgi:hypothetical protein